MEGIRAGGGHLNQERRDGWMEEEEETGLSAMMMTMIGKFILNGN